MLHVIESNWDIPPRFVPQWPLGQDRPGAMLAAVIDVAIRRIVVWTYRSAMAIVIRGMPARNGQGNGKQSRSQPAARHAQSD